MSRAIEVRPTRPLHGAGIRYLPIAVILTTATMVAVLWLSSSRLLTNALWQDHADTLIIEAVGRDLISGGNLLDWRLTPAPYLFPDIALAMAFSPFVDVGQVARFVQFALLVLGAVSWYWLAKRLGLSAWASMLVSALFSTLFALSFFHAELKSTVALYFGLPGHHSSIAATLPIALLCMFHLYLPVGPKSNDPFQGSQQSRMITAAILCWIVLVCLALSDGIFSMALIAPASFFIGLRAWTAQVRKGVEFFPHLLCSALLAGAFVVAEAFHRALPYPQKNESFQFFLQRVNINFPAIPFEAARGIAAAPFESSVTLLVFAVAGSSFAALAISLWQQLKARRCDQVPRGEPIVPVILLGLLIGIALLPVGQIVLGLWTGPDVARQFAWALLCLPTLGGIYLLKWRPQLGTLAIACVSTTIALAVLIGTRGNERTAYKARYPNIVACMLTAHPEGFHFVGDFWDVLPITLYSGGRASGLAVLGEPTSPVPFTSGQKISRLRSLTPTFVVVKPGSDAQRYSATFGMPADQTRCGKDGLELWDYRNNHNFLHRFSDLARHAY